MTPAETLAKAKQLDRFLGRAVTDIKASDRTTMNKFAELAAKVKADQESMFAEVADLSTESDKVSSQFKEAASRYRTVLEEAKAGIKSMNEIAAAMAGNGGPLPDSPQQLPVSEQQPAPVVAEQPAPAAEAAPVAEAMPGPTPGMDATATGNPPA